MDFLTSWQTRRVLVTGGTGFVGQHVLRQGLAAGLEVINIAHAGDVPDGVQNYQIDFRDRAQLRDLIETINPDGIIHLAAAGVAYDTGNLADLLEINVLGLQTILDVAVRLTIPPPVIVAGSWFEYAPQDRPYRETDPTDAIMPYSASKIAAHAVASHYGTRLPVTVLRLFSLYGPGERVPRLIPYIIEQAQRSEPVELTACEQVRDYVYVVDAAEAFWRALVKSPATETLRVLNIGTGIPLKLKSFVQTLVTVLHTKDINPDIRFGARAYRPNENMYAVAQIDRLLAELDWRPATPLEVGLSHMVDAQLGL